MNVFETAKCNGAKRNGGTYGKDPNLLGNNSSSLAKAFIALTSVAASISMSSTLSLASLHSSPPTSSLTSTSSLASTSSLPST